MNFAQFVVIHTVKGFSVVNEAEVAVFLEFSCFFYDPAELAILSLVLLTFLNQVCTSGSSRFTSGKVAKVLLRRLKWHLVFQR